MADEGPPPIGHLARLSFEGSSTSAGSYTPQRVDLHLTGHDVVQDVVVRLHEIHHQVLNDATAWGTALHVLARTGPANQQVFADLLDAARLAHESYATFASISTVLARHPDAETVLDAYPKYEALYRATVRMLSGVGGEHRQYLAATAAARVAMQTPVLDAIAVTIATDTRPFELSTVRAIDTPNARWRWIERRPNLLTQAATEADAKVRASFGTGALTADSAEDRTAPAEDHHDAAWAAWEHHVYDRLAAALRTAGATVLGFDDHRHAAEALIEAVRATHPGIGVWADSSAPAPDDRALASAAIGDTRVHLTPTPWRAALLEADEGTIVNHRCGYLIGGVPSMILDVRLPERLRALYRWEPGHEEDLARATTPLPMCRLMGDEEGEDVVLNVRVGDTNGLDRLSEAWDDRGPVVTIVAASCFIHKDWTAEWLPLLESIGHVVVLVDVEVGRFIGNWDQPGVAVSGSNIEIADAMFGTRHAVAFRSTNSAALWLYVGDEVTSRLLTHVIGSATGIELELSDDLAAEQAQILRITLTHLLATESFTDLDGLAGHI